MVGLPLTALLLVNVWSLQKIVSFREILIIVLLKIIAYSYAADIGAFIKKIYVGVRVAVADDEISEEFIVT